MLSWLADVKTTAEYRHTLLGFYGFQHPCEDAVGNREWRGSGWDPQEHIRIPDLVADLGELGVGPAALAESKLWVVEPLPTLVEVIGVAFVLEGSRAGARIIAGMISANIPDAPLRYFAGGPAATAWRPFNLTLNRVLDTPARIAIARDVAVATMEGITRWFQTWHPVSEV